MDVLLDEDVSRKGFVEDPIAYSGLERRHSRLVLPIEIICVVIGLPKSEVAYLSVVNTLDERPIAVRVALLESDMNADLCARPVLITRLQPWTSVATGFSR